MRLFYPRIKKADRFTDQRFELALRCLPASTKRRETAMACNRHLRLVWRPWNATTTSRMRLI